MLDLAGDYVCIAEVNALRSSENRAFQRVIASLRAAGGEDDFITVRSQEVRDLTAGLFHRMVSDFAVDVRARWVAVMLAQKGEHDFHDGRIDRGGGVVVEVYGFHEMGI